MGKRVTDLDAAGDFVGRLGFDVKTGKSEGVVHLHEGAGAVDSQESYRESSREHDLRGDQDIREDGTARAGIARRHPVASLAAEFVKFVSVVDIEDAAEAAADIDANKAGSGATAFLVSNLPP
jgi:hypothetical protein